MSGNFIRIYKWTSNRWRYIFNDGENEGACSKDEDEPVVQILEDEMLPFPINDPKPAEEVWEFNP